MLTSTTPALRILLLLLSALLSLTWLFASRTSPASVSLVRASITLPPADLQLLHPQIPLSLLLDEENTADFTHLRSYHIPRTPVSIRQCDQISAHLIQQLAVTAELKPRSSPIIHHFHNGRSVTPDGQEFNVGDEFCSVYYVPQNPRTNLSEYQNVPIEGMGPDSIHAQVFSNDIWLVFQHPDFWGLCLTAPSLDNPSGVIVAIYTTAYALHHPGTYQISGEVEFQNYDWVMEDPVDTHFHSLPYEMMSLNLEPESPPLIIVGAPASRPTAKCYQDGHNDLRGRWYRATSFSHTGNQTALNPQARLEFAEHNTTFDEWGWTFAPDACSLTYFSPEDHLSCLSDRRLQVLGDSNSRRVMKSIMGGGISWCQDPHESLCQCEDQYQDSFQDIFFNTINASRFRNQQDRADPTIFGRNSALYFDYIGGLLNQAVFNPWYVFFDSSPDSPSIIAQRAAAHGPLDLVHLSTLGWDLAGVKTPTEMLAALPGFRTRFLAAYAPGTRIVTRLANSLCCGNANRGARYSAPRFAIWNDMYRRFWAADEAAGTLRIVDPTVLQGRADAEQAFSCPTTHLRASHVRLEQMMWMGAVCEKEESMGGVMAEARMSDWGL